MGKVSKRPQKPKKSKSLTYSSYLKVEELISLQEPLSSPEAHDEMLFIIVHQTYELWFKQVLHELEALTEHINKDELLVSYRYLDRVCEIFKVLIQQIDILETMTPVEFNRFRTHLNPASGFQSMQFRELELMLGVPQSAYAKFFKLEPEWKDALKVRLKKPTLRDAYKNLLKRRGIVKNVSDESLVDGVLKIYNDEELYPVHNLCEYFIRLDEQLLLWRFRHVQMVERMIGMKRGTGGSLGVSYLQQTLSKKLFPELWEARTSMEGLTH